MKTTIKRLQIFMVILSLTTIIQAKNSSFKKNHKHKENISFIPMDAFGGNHAQGEYTRKGKTAIIYNDDAIYSFNKIKTDKNPSLKKNKLDLIKIGSFSHKTNRFGMPSVTYLFGAGTNEETQNVIDLSNKTKLLLQNEKVLDDSDYQTSYSAITFQPSQEFSGEKLVGNYLSSSHMATIQDPSGINNQIYIFENIVEGLPPSMTSDTVRPMYQPILIGSYASTPHCSNGIPKICSNAIKITQLYGNLKQIN